MSASAKSVMLWDRESIERMAAFLSAEPVNGQDYALGEQLLAHCLALEAVRLERARFEEDAAEIAIAHRAVIRERDELRACVRDLQRALACQQQHLSRHFFRQHRYLKAVGEG